MTPRVYLSSIQEPIINLAIEEHLFATVGRGEPILLLYRNRPSVVIGRHQNPWLECDLALIAADGVQVARRISGGGAVFHDLGNTNYSFMAHDSDYDLERNFKQLTTALGELGIEARRGERNDLWCRGRKFSGTAFRHSRGASLHHGTLLIRTNLDRLTAYLTARSIARIRSRGIDSVRSRVINIGEISASVTHKAICSQLARSFVGAADAVREVTEAWIDSRPEIREIAEKRRAWAWRFGHTPRFVIEMHVSEVNLTVEVDRGLIMSALVDGQEGTALEQHLRGARFERHDITTRATSLDSALGPLAVQLSEFAR